MLTYSNAIQFNGSSQYAARTGSGSAVNNNFSMMCWVYINAYRAGDSSMFQNGANDARGEVMRFTNAGVFYADFHFIANINSGYTLNLSTWYHVCLIRNSGTSQLYVNGAAQGGTIGNTPNSGTDWIVLGAESSSGGSIQNYANCIIDDARFYERAISTSELSTIVSNALIYPFTDISNTNLFEWYKCDESSGNPQDSSGTGRHLTATGSPTYTTGIIPNGSSGNNVGNLLSMFR